MKNYHEAVMMNNTWRHVERRSREDVAEGGRPIVVAKGRNRDGTWDSTGILYPVKHWTANDAEAHGAAVGAVRFVPAPDLNELRLVNSSESSYTPRSVQHEGRPYLAVPCIALIEGVHAGSGGPMFYPAEELSAFAAAWNGEPVVVGHPHNAHGDPVSANAPEVIESEKIGVVFHSVFDETLRGIRYELYIDEQLAESRCPDVLRRLRAGEMIEVSTGLFSDDDGTPGEWRGEEYQGTIRNIRPDHLAILRDSTGACSISDGCGVRANEEEENSMDHGAMVTALRKAGFKVHDVGYGETSQLLQRAIDTMDTRVTTHFLKEVYDDTFIYEARPTEMSGAAKLFRRSYTTDDGEGSVVLGDDVTEVNRKVEYVPVTNEGSGEIPGKEEGGKSVSVNEKVAALIGCECTKFTADDEAFLTGLSEEQLDKLGPVDAEEEKPKEGEDKGAEGDGPAEGAGEDGKPTGAEDGAADTPPPAEQTPEAFLETAPEGIREILTEGLERRKAERTSTIAAITGNEKCAFSTEELKGMSLKSLRKLAAIAEVEPAGDFSARAGAIHVQEDTNAGPGPAPDPWAKKE